MVVLGLALLVGPAEGALADDGSDSIALHDRDRGRHNRQRHRHRPRRHRPHRGEKIEPVPELDPRSSAAALILLVGTGVLLHERRRVRVVTSIPAA